MQIKVHNHTIVDQDFYIYIIYTYMSMTLWERTLDMYL